jgi:hypothetical protein
VSGAGYAPDASPSPSGGERDGSAVRRLEPNDLFLDVRRERDDTLLAKVYAGTAVS